MSARSQRILFAVTALAVAVALLLRITLTATSDSGIYGDNRVENVLNIFCYFTIFSNILVGITCGLLALDLKRPTFWFRVLRIDSIVCIIVTAIVYHLLLAGDEDLHGWSYFTNQLLHTVVPILAVVGWVVAGPRGQLTKRIAGASLVLPILWLVLTFIRGAIVDFYPYDFLDPGVDGVGAVVITTGVIVAAFIAMAFASIGLDRLLTKNSVDPARN